MLFASRPLYILAGSCCGGPAGWPAGRPAGARGRLGAFFGAGCPVGRFMPLCKSTSAGRRALSSPARATDASATVGRRPHGAQKRGPGAGAPRCRSARRRCAATRRAAPAGGRDGPLTRQPGSARGAASGCGQRPGRRQGEFVMAGAASLAAAALAYRSARVPACRLTSVQALAPVMYDPSTRLVPRAPQ